MIGCHNDCRPRCKRTNLVKELTSGLTMKCKHELSTKNALYWSFAVEVVTWIVLCFRKLQLDM